MAAATGYVLGHQDPEVERLLLQGRLYGDHTEQALRLAGLEPGMRVLDVGCGPGDVALAAARIVGPTGSVTAVDVQADILDVAALRSAAEGVSTISFRQVDITQPTAPEQTAPDHTAPDHTAPEPFDAVVGRLILMHLPDPVGALRTVAGLVRPGGVVTFQDFEVSAARSVPELPLFTRVRDLIVAAFRTAGARTEMGTSLHRVFREAGLPAPRSTLGGCLGRMSDPDVLAFVMGVWSALLPVVERLGPELTEGLPDLADLPDRLCAEAAAADATVLLPPLVSAWTRRPAEWP
ncbi:class I SAM-dependent methyltransferase [Pseudonocardia pini]|uniref:class I SAM-dependent methyltransferase n=1 Tax=Pseudonocardia pini TaxID=2758030 RepID=UPI0015F05DEA|nr:class I SAM-dependent methyltransferase [Pseudonocardia pini]